MYKSYFKEKDNDLKSGEKEITFFYLKDGQKFRFAKSDLWHIKTKYQKYKNGKTGKITKVTHNPFVIIKESLIKEDSDKVNKLYNRLQNLEDKMNGLDSRYQNIKDKYYDTNDQDQKKRYDIRMKKLTVQMNELGDKIRDLEKKISTTEK
jgi:chaperonin cofactor prefoldin